VSCQFRSAWGHRPIHGPLAAAAITLLACGGGTEPTLTTAGPSVSPSISPSRLGLLIGGKGQLVAQALDAQGRGATASFEWTSASPAIATVGLRDGVVTAISSGATTVTAAAGTLRATATVTVRPRTPSGAAVVISPSALSLPIGAPAGISARAYDSNGLPRAVPFEWSSADPAIATVGKTDGIVTGVSVGETTVTAAVGELRGTMAVSVEPELLLEQFATGATASTEYSRGGWSAKQATGGASFSTECADDGGAWASLSQDGVDWLELTYTQPVHPSEIRIFEVWGVGSIVKVELKDVAGEYHTVYTAQPVGSQRCPRVLIIAVSGVTKLVSTVRVSVDQRGRFDRDEIDAVSLAGYP
jgi:hypothetical protein